MLRKINWKLAGKDSYYRARREEDKARQEEGKGNPREAVKHWRRYAEGKERKGSLLLATYGQLNMARNYEKTGNWKKAADHYQKASENAEKLSGNHFWIISSLLRCQMYYAAGNYRKCIHSYEELGRTLQQKRNYFLSADAYEHAAEVMYQTGMNMGRYLKPVDAWRRNAQYWVEEGNDDDAEWSLNRIELYRKLFKK